ncbi:MAG: GDSL-type esterase/lipase family protein [Armatimonadia bacterium]
MKQIIVVLAVVLLASVALAAPVAEVSFSDSPKGYKMVTHEGRTFGLAFEKNMEKFAADDLTDPRRGLIVFTGSSTFTGWSTVKSDMAPLPVVNRGFGGSNSAQLWWYADRAVLPRRPKLIVVYIGDNDMPQADVTIENYMKYVRLFLGRVWEQDAKTRLIFVSNKPSPSRWKLWDKYQASNAALREMCEGDARLTYVDISPTLLDAQGQVRPECFKEDMLHMKPEMYAEWTKVIKPVVERVWGEVAGAE